MNFKLMIGVVVSCMLQPVWGQSLKISGWVSDPHHQPLEAASVVLRSLPDSTLVSNLITEKSGRFDLDVTAPKKYLLTVSFLGLKTFQKDVLPADLGEICLEENLQTLGKATVKAGRKIVSMKNGKLIYNAKQLALTHIVDNALDIVDNLPGIRKDSKGYYFRNQSVTIMVDGKPSVLDQTDLCLILQTIPIEHIVEIEFMQSAPANYRVKGPVVNFITKRPDQFGVEGMIRGKYLNRHHNAGDASANLRIASPKTTLDFMYSLNRSNYYEPCQINSHHKIGNEVFHIVQDYGYNTKDWKNVFKVGLTQNFSEKSMLDINYYGKISPSTHRLDFSKSNLTSSDNHKDGENNLHNVSLFYKSGVGLRFGADYLRYHTKDKQDMTITPNETNETGKILAHQGQTADRFKVYADMEHQLNKKWTLGYGASYSYTRDKDYQIYTDNSTDKDLFDTNSPIEEHLTELYLSTGYTGEGKHSFNASLNAEYCKNTNFSAWDFFPQIVYGYNESGDHALQVVLSSQKDYPGFWDMHETISHINDYLERQGAPGLKSMGSYSLHTNYILKHKYILALQFDYIKDPFFMIPYQDPNRLAMIYKTQNWDYEFRTALDFIIPFSIGTWFNAEYTTSLGLVHQKCDHYMDISFNRKMFAYTQEMRHVFKLCKSLMLELDIYGQTKTPHGTNDYLGFIEASAGLKWKFAHDKMNLSVRCTDLFNSSYVKTEANYKGQDFSLTRFKNCNRAVEVNLSYRFGGYKERATKRVDTSRFGH